MDGRLLPHEHTFEINFDKAPPKHTQGVEVWINAFVV